MSFVPYCTYTCPVLYTCRVICVFCICYKHVYMHAHRAPRAHYGRMNVISAIMCFIHIALCHNHVIEVLKVSIDTIFPSFEAVKEFVHHANKMCSLRSILPSGELNSLWKWITNNLRNKKVDSCAYCMVCTDQLTCAARSTLILEKELRDIHVYSNLILGIILTPWPAAVSLLYGSWRCLHKMSFLGGEYSVYAWRPRLIKSAANSPPQIACYTCI